MVVGVTALQHRADALAATLPPLLVQALQVAATVVQGVHGRRRTGPGDSFWQFRRYQQGDSAHAIDWRQSAKSDRLYVRESEWAAAQSVWLWPDPSASMRWRSSAALPEKRERAELLSLALAALLTRGGERAGLLGAAAEPSWGRGVLLRLASEFDEQRSDPGLPDVPLPRHGHVVLISDFLMPLDAVAASVRGWARRGANGHLLQVLDPAEETLPYEGRLRFAGLEDEGDLLVPQVESLRDAYVRRLAEQRAGLAAIARSVDWSFAVHHTDRSARAALTELHAALAERV
jgi:uncharacterized protein (DUF58 family)